MAEHSVIFNQNYLSDKKEFESFLVFTVVDIEGNYEEVEVPVSCGEDIELRMSLYFNKNYSKLFLDIFNVRDIVEISFEGISMRGVSDKGRFSTYLTNNYKKNTVIVNERVITDVNKDKLLKIRDIILK